MTAEIKRLTAAGPAIGKPEEDVVELAKKILSMAKKGEIIGLGLFWVNANLALSDEWAGGCADQHLMQAACTRLFFRVSQTTLD